MTGFRIFWRALLLATAVLASGPAGAQEVRVEVPAAFENLRDPLRAVSRTARRISEDDTTALDLLAAARSDYQTMLGRLYEDGYYAAEISILFDGQEVADISPFDSPESVALIRIRANPGPQFVFGDLDVGPLPPEIVLPEAFQRGAVAQSRLIRNTGQAIADGWRANGFAKVEIIEQRIIANHSANELDVTLRFSTGPRLRFGELLIPNQTRVRESRVRAIAGFPSGEIYSPEEVRDVRDRLLDTGAFRLVVLEDAEEPSPEGTLDVIANLDTEVPRRLGFGAEYNTSEGVQLSATWFHRNIFGGAERLRFDANVRQRLDGDLDPEFGVLVTFRRPATPDPRTSLIISTEFRRESETDFQEDIAELFFGFERQITETLLGEAGLLFVAVASDVPPNQFDFRVLGLRGKLTEDRRDDENNTKSGFFLQGEVVPYAGLADADSGVRATFDGRAYFSFGGNNALTIATRAQLGSVFAADIAATPETFLFFSGGSGTVRGHEFRSLGVNIGGSELGGAGFAAASLEIRYDVTDTIGVVGFFDAGYVSADPLPDTNGRWQTGAGLGVRYATPIGPLRLDLGLPVSGDGDGLQFYIGLGQAF